MKNAKTNSVKAFILTLVLLLTTALFPFTAASQTIEELESQHQEIEDKIDENKQKLEQKEEQKNRQQQAVSKIESELNDYNSKIGALDDKIANLQGDIDTLNSSAIRLDNEIESINSSITEIKIRISMQNEKIRLTQSKVIDRLRLSYMNGEASFLELLLGVDTLTEILTWRQFLQNASDYDQNLIHVLSDEVDELNELNSRLDSTISSINHKKAELESEKDELKEKQTEIQTSVDELEGQKKSVEEKRRQAVALLKQLDKESAEYKNIEKMLIKEQEKVDAEIDRLINDKGTKFGDDLFDNADKPFIFPLKYSPSECYTSAGYGQYPSGGTHRGVDMCVSAQGKTYGAEIVAAQSGKALEVGNHSTMGNYIILDHGNGITTVYMHCSVLKITGGQTVQQGQVIGLVGDTGNTTGPHLHFEVRISGQGSVNPGNYITIPPKR